jgi:hypothetical protein
MPRERERENGPAGGGAILELSGQATVKTWWQQLGRELRPYFGETYLFLFFDFCLNIYWFSVEHHMGMIFKGYFAIW